MSWCSAGHPQALLHDLDTDEIRDVGTKDDGGLPLAIAPEIGYDAVLTKLPPRCRVLVFSDGMTDALSPGDGNDAKMFGTQGIIDTLRACRHETIDVTMDRLFSESRAFTRGEGRHDDTSAVLVERTSE